MSVIKVNLIIENTIMDLFYLNLARMAEAYLDTLPAAERDEVRPVLVGFGNWIESVLDDDDETN